MDITVNCPCGSNYEFTEELVDGRLRFPISCPNCGTDGTTLAHEYIRKVESGELKPNKKVAVDDETDSGPRKVRIGFGVVGACIGGFAGLMIWYAVHRQLGVWFDFGFMRWIIGALALFTGALAGLGARLAVPSGSFGLAGVAAFAAATAIMGGQYFATRETVDRKLNQGITAAYDGMKGYAQQVMGVTSDGAISRILNRYGFNPHDVGFGESYVFCVKRLLPYFNVSFHVTGQGSAGPRNESARAFMDDDTLLSAADLALFREKELPELREFVAGEPSKAEFAKALMDGIHSRISMNDMIVQSWSPSQFLWLVLGVVSAYRIAHNRSEVEDF